MGVSYRPIEGGCGVEILGMDLDRPVDATTAEELCALWVQHGLLIWRGGSPSAETQVKLSAVFGRNSEHMSREMWVEGFPTLISLKSSPDMKSEDNDIYSVDGVELAGYKPWHSDLIHQLNPNRGAMLRAVTLPEEGGDTGFVDRIAAYEALPDALKAEIENLRVVYAVIPNAADIKFSTGVKLSPVRLSARVEDYDRRKHEFARVTQPLVYKQEETGRKALFLSPWFAQSIEGQEGPEGDALLQQLVDHLIAHGGVYMHKWRAGDLVLWDNWRMAHLACGTPPHCSRELHRTTILREWGLARLYGGAGAAA